MISDPFAHAEMEIKFELDTEKAAKATVAIAASYGLGRVSESTNYPQIAFANVIALIAIIAKPLRPLPGIYSKVSKHDAQCNHSPL